MMPRTLFYCVQEDANLSFINFEYGGFLNDFAVECLTSNYGAALAAYNYDPKHRRLLKVKVETETLRTESESNWG